MMSAAQITIFDTVLFTEKELFMLIPRFFYRIVFSIAQMAYKFNVNKVKSGK